MAIWGWSGGGSNTLNAMFRKPDVYHVGIAVAPKPQPDLYNAWFQEIFMRTREENPEGYRQPGRKQLHEVPIWLEEGRAGPYIRYCGSSEQLAVEMENPDKFRAVEVRDAQRMLNWAMLQQSDVLHELALAYYDRHAAKQDSELGQKVQAAYEQAKQDDGYKSVLRFDGQRVPHPGLTSERQYFAELMESYFLVNDQYPFVRCELKDHDSAGYALIAALW